MHRTLQKHNKDYFWPRYDRVYNMIGKVTDDKQWPLLISLKDESKKLDIFQNLNNVRESEAHSTKIIIGYDLKKIRKKNCKKKFRKHMKGSRMTSQENEYIIWRVYCGTGMWQKLWLESNKENKTQLVVINNLPYMYTNADTYQFHGGPFIWYIHSPDWPVFERISDTSLNE